VRLMHRRRGATALVVASVAVVVTVLGSVAAWGTTTGAQASLTDLQVKDGELTGVLTLRSGSEDARVDTDSLRVTVGGETNTPTTTSVNSQRRATMLVVDTSGSMSEDDMATVREATQAFLDDAPKDVLVGLVSFAQRAELEVGLGRNRDAVQQGVDGLQPGGETALDDAIVLATEKLGTKGDRSILLLTDGKDTVSDASQREATSALKSAGVRAELIGFRTSDTDTQALNQIAQAGQGGVAQASNTDAVTAAFRDVAQTLESQVAFTVPTPTDLTGIQEVVATGTANGEKFTARSTVDVGGGGSASPSSGTSSDQPTAAVVGPGPTDNLPTPWYLALALAAVFAGLLLLTASMLSPMLASDRQRRVESIERYMTGRVVQVQDHHQRGGANPSAIGQNIVNISEKYMQGRSSTAKTLLLLERADLPWRAGEWLVIRVASVVVGMAVFLLLLPVPRWLAALIGFLVGFAVPALWLRFKAGRRARKFEGQLPDLLMVVASSLQSGFSLTQALDSAAKDGPDPASKEFSRALAEARIGTDIADALDRVGERMASTNMMWTSMAIRIQRQVGGNLAETLRTTAATLREREALAGQIRALSAEGRLSAWILVLLPIGMFFYMLLVNYDYISLLWQGALGILMLVGAVVAIVIGIFWMRRVVRVEV
jgi:tight adherence protein B